MSTNSTRSYRQYCSIDAGVRQHQVRVGGHARDGAGRGSDEDRDQQAGKPDRVSAPQPDLLGRNCASGRFRLYASRAGRKDFAGVGMALARSGAFGKLDPPYPSIVNS